MSHDCQFTLGSQVNITLLVISRCCHRLTWVQQAFFAADDSHRVQFLGQWLLKVIDFVLLVFPLLLFVEADDDFEVAERDDDLAYVQRDLPSKSLSIRPVCLRELYDVVDHVAEQQHYHEDGEGNR